MGMSDDAEFVPLLCNDNCDPLPAQQDGNTPFEFTLQEVIDLLHQMEVEYKTADCCLSSKTGNRKQK